MTAAALTIPAVALAQPGATGSAAAPPAKADTIETVDKRGSVAGASEFDALRGKAADGTVRVIVGMQTRFTPEGALSSAETDDQRAGIGRKRDELLAALKGTKHEVVHTYDRVPYVALKLSTGALARLEQSGLAASLQEDVAVPALLAQSGPLVEATESVAVGRSGLNQHIAILDTGVQKAHLFLQQSNGTPKVVSEACYNNLASCPGGASTAAGTGEPCTLAGCDHGTHVAGIAAGRGTTSSGVARDAKLIAIQIFSNVSGCGTCTFTSDQIKGLERVDVLSGSLSIASVNMSLGGGLSTTDCDSDSRKPIIDTLRSKGIATAIASGNDGSNSAVSFPACISSAITVGSTTKTDAVSSFSNSSPLVELLAPGSSIVSSIVDGSAPFDAQGTKSGTSMATPHVAGAWAVMKGVSPAASVSTVLSALQSTGKPVTDPDNSVVKPRIRVLAGGTRLADTGMRAAFSSSGTGMDMVSAGVGLRGTGSGTITQAGIPAGATLVSTRLIWTTIGGPDASVVFNGVATGGTLVGASRDTCWNINQLGPNRTYYRTLSPLGNGTYTISGVGAAGVAEAQGASLVTIYTKPSGGVGRVYTRIGASSAVNSGESAITTVTTVGNGVHVRRPTIHVAVGDGQSFTESPLRFGGVAITAPDYFSGLAGAYWDDETVGVATGMIPSGTTTKSIGVIAGSDCLVLTHAAVSYETTA